MEGVVSVGNSLNPDPAGLIQCPSESSHCALGQPWPEVVAERTGAVHRRFRTRLARRRPAVWTDAREQMQFVVGDAETEDVIEELAARVHQAFHLAR